MNSTDSMVLIGLGRIGYKGFPQTHYQCAISNKLKVVAGIDSSLEARVRFTSETGIPSYESLSELHDEHWSSFFSVTSTNDASFEILIQLLSRNDPLGILAEKPFCSNAAQSQQILTLQENMQTPLRINYSRQYSKAMPEIKSLIAKNNLISGAVIYSSGLRENGSHFIRLLCGLFPTVLTYQNIEWIDGTQFKLQVGDKLKINFVPLESPYLHNSQIRLIFSDFIISVSDGSKVEARRINTNSPIRNWPHELELILDADFSDGFESSYLDQSWWRSPNLQTISEELKLDHLCNALLETAPLENVSEPEEF
jgi:hypothetical protein